MSEGVSPSRLRRGSSVRSTKTTLVDGRREGSWDPGHHRTTYPILRTRSDPSRASVSSCPRWNGVRDDERSSNLSPDHHGYGRTHGSRSGPSPGKVIPEGGLSTTTSPTTLGTCTKVCLIVTSDQRIRFEDVVESKVFF